uniref:Sosondowah ankyrin repeat domain family member C n=1 Tax=Crocodylus porosus TaxID=8502 RepID=A0A7M4FEU3_CROPO
GYCSPPSWNAAQTLFSSPTCCSVFCSPHTHPEDSLVQQRSTFWTDTQPTPTEDHSNPHPPPDLLLCFPLPAPIRASLASGSSAAEEGGGAGGAVALDPLEHAWMLAAAEGRWESLEGLLSCEPGLLAKRDFVTGFTCLHWAAKHGRQELLAHLVAFARKQGLAVDVNARSGGGGYTALHLAAMHGHLEVVKLLVGACDADVDVRDYGGRKAAQYLDRGTPEEMRSLVGALQEEEEDEGTAPNGSGRWRLSKVLPQSVATARKAAASVNHA